MIANDQVVSIHYELTDEKGKVLDSSAGRDPLNYLHGHHNIVPGLEEALSGKDSGDKVDVVVEPEKAYGPHHEERVVKIPRAEISVPDLNPGMRLKAETPQGLIPIKVVEVTDEEVTVDANHELAGVTLYFSVEIISIRSAEQAEIDRGRPA